MIGNRFKLIRKEKNLTQKVFAETLSISPGYVSEIEKGKKIPGGEVLSSLKRIFQVDINWLLDGTGKMFLTENSNSALSEEHQLLINSYDAASEDARNFALKGLQDSAEKSRSTGLKGSDCAKLNSA